MSPPRDRIYDLLPAVYRQRDAALGQPLRALLAVVDEEAAGIERDIATLYDNWFIETCDEWVVPYIADLLGVRGLHSLEGGVYSQRALVANAITARRRKGTAAVLEQIARDVTGWPARAVEFFESLATTQHANHPRLGRGGTADIRDAGRLELLGGPFQSASFTADVRHVDLERGRYNIPNVGLFLWRLQEFPVARATARAFAPPADGCYTFDPLGVDSPLFNRPARELEASHLAGEENVPAPLRRRPLTEDLAALKAAIIDGRDPDTRYFGDEPVFQLYVRAPNASQWREIAPFDIGICHLDGPPSSWRRPAGSWASLAANVDPVRGRLVLPAGVVPDAQDVEVSFAYGFPGDLGGGPYDRRASVAPWTEDVTWQMGVTRGEPASTIGIVDDVGAVVGNGSGVVGTVAGAIAAWNAYVQSPAVAAGTERAVGVIALLDSRSYDEALTSAAAIRIPARGQLLIAAADWPAEETEIPGVTVRRLGRTRATARRPHLRGSVFVRGTAPSTVTGGSDPGALVIDGLLVEGGVQVLAGNLGALRLQHSTIVPTLGGVQVTAGTQAAEKNEKLVVTLQRSISGPLFIPESVQQLELEDSIVDAGDGDVTSSAIAIKAPGMSASGKEMPGPPARIVASTIVGRTRVRTLEASNSLFTGKVTAARRQTGCVRFCYLPTSSVVARRYRCIPASEASSRRVVPEFTAVDHGQPAYLQLTPSSAVEIRTGADDEGELGAFHFLQQAQRIANLRASLDEYLRFGLEAGVFLVT